MKQRNMIIMTGLLILALAMPVFARAADAPFGLEWGMSKAEVASLGVVLRPLRKRFGIQVMQTFKLPKNVPIVESYGLTFDNRFGLQKVEMVSEDIMNDPSGEQGRKIYSDLKESLEKKYGKPAREMEVVGKKLWTEADEFYLCLAYTGCGMWGAIFDHEPSGQKMLLKIEGRTRTRGFIRLTYEGPNWSRATKVFQVKESVEAEEAL